LDTATLLKAGGGRAGHAGGKLIIDMLLVNLACQMTTVTLTFWEDDKGSSEYGYVTQDGAGGITLRNSKCYFVVDVEGDARILSAENMRTSWRAWSEREGKLLCIHYY
jgi:hypothetical protein